MFRLLVYFDSMKADDVRSLEVLGGMHLHRLCTGGHVRRAGSRVRAISGELPRCLDHSAFDAVLIDMRLVHRGVAQSPARFAPHSSVRFAHGSWDGLHLMTSTRIAKRPLQDDWAKHHTVFVLGGGTNDFDPTGANHTGEQGISDMQAGVAVLQASGFKCLVPTVLTRADLTGGDLATYEARRAVYNAAVRAGTTGADGIVDWDADSRLQDANNATYFYSGDKLHLTPAANDIIAAMTKAAIEALP